MTNTTIGILLLVMAVVFLLGDKLAFVGHLPGDLRLKLGQTTVFIPLGTCLAASIVLSLLLSVFGKR